MKIKEGLRQDDLEGLVLPVLSIDEYESKIDDTAIVVGFFVKYQDPANDLNRFIQKSAIDIIDTEVSPAPTEDGYYVVFLELERSSSFIKKIMHLLENLTNLVEFDDWTFTTVGYEEKIKLTEKNLKSYLNLSPILDSGTNHQTNGKNQDESIEEFFSMSLLNSFLIENNNLTLVRNRKKYSFNILDFGSTSIIKERNSKILQRKNITEGVHANGQTLMSILGSHWIIDCNEKCISITNNLSKSTMILAQ